MKMRLIRWGIVFTAIMLLFTFVSERKRPKLISSIRVIDQAYLTVLVGGRRDQDVEKLKEVILKMCREDAFKEMKLQTEDRPMPKNLYISVYLSRKDLKEGNIFLIIKSDQNHSSSKSQIPSAAKCYSR